MRNDDDVFDFVLADYSAELWSERQRYFGRQRAFWQDQSSSSW